jgi:hypothetical protein
VKDCPLSVLAAALRKHPSVCVCVVHNSRSLVLCGAPSDLLKVKIAVQGVVDCARFAPLGVPLPLHTDAMQPGADAAIAKVREHFRDISAYSYCKLFSCVDGEMMDSRGQPDYFSTVLQEAVCRPLQWGAGLRRAYQLCHCGPRIVELGLGGPLGAATCLSEVGPPTHQAPHILRTL